MTPLQKIKGESFLQGYDSGYREGHCDAVDEVCEYLSNAMSDGKMETSDFDTLIKKLQETTDMNLVNTLGDDKEK